MTLLLEFWARASTKVTWSVLELCLHLPHLLSLLATCAIYNTPPFEISAFSQILFIWLGHAKEPLPDAASALNSLPPLVGFLAFFKVLKVYIWTSFFKALTATSKSWQTTSGVSGRFFILSMNSIFPVFFFHNITWHWRVVGWSSEVSFYHTYLFFTLIFKISNWR